MPGTDRTHLQALRRPEDLQAWEPIDGYALVTCEVLVLSGAYSGVETRSYEIRRAADIWFVETNTEHGTIGFRSWTKLVDWLCGMRPTNIELLTTV